MKANYDNFPLLAIMESNSPEAIALAKVIDEWLEQKGSQQ